MKMICLDTGVITQFISNEPLDPIITVMNRVIKEEFECHIANSVFVEVFNPICKIKRIEFARIALSSFTRKIPHIEMSLDKVIFISAGMIKCQHRTSLSYIDCMSIDIS